jgi:HEXXH motif-containing protein
MDQRPDAPWELPGLELASATAPWGTDWLWKQVVTPIPEVAVHVRRAGLDLADAHDADPRQFAEAAKAIAEVPRLAAIVAARIRSVHVLRADPGYDVSHSEPLWPDRIFVSVPERAGEVSALRLAESVIHEAMHLHLSEMEAVTPLVADLTGVLPSPWRSEPRPYGGVLHGAFVFTCLNAYFERLPARSHPRANRHLRDRRDAISEELAQIDFVSLTNGLTKQGVALISRLVASYRNVGAAA